MSATQKKWNGKTVEDSSAFIASGLIISVKEARKVLGRDAELLSDDDVIKLVSSFTRIANGFLQSSI